MLATAPAVAPSVHAALRCRRSGCRHDITAHRGRAYLGGCTTPGCECALLLVPPTQRRALRATLHEPDRALVRYEASRSRSHKTRRARKRGKWGVGPSDLNACRAWIGYRERGDYEPVPVDKRAAAIGNLLHDVFTDARRALYPWRTFGLRVRIDGLDEPGTLDEYDRLIGRVTDYKTCGDWKWDRIGEHGPFFDEVEQVMVYALGLLRMGLPVREVELVYVHRGTGAHESFLRPFDEAIALAAIDRLIHVLDALDAGRELPRDREGPTTSPLCRSYCAAVRTCWGLDEVPEGRSPEGWLFARDDPAIEVVCRDYLEARERGDKDAQARARVLLEGAPAGTYGEFILTWRGGKTSWVDDPKARLEQLEGALSPHRVDRPTLADLPMPQMRVVSNVSINVARQRAAQREAKARG